MADSFSIDFLAPHLYDATNIDPRFDDAKKTQLGFLLPRDVFGPRVPDPGFPTALQELIARNARNKANLDGQAEARRTQAAANAAAKKKANDDAAAAKKKANDDAAAVKTKANADAAAVKAKEEANAALKQKAEANRLAKETAERAEQNRKLAEEKQRHANMVNALRQGTEGLRSTLENSLSAKTAKNKAKHNFYMDLLRRYRNSKKNRGATSSTGEQADPRAGSQSKLPVIQNKLLELENKPRTYQKVGTWPQLSPRNHPQIPNRTVANPKTTAIIPYTKPLYKLRRSTRKLSR